MLTYHRTSILDSRAQTLVNTVNTVGIMGKGLAHEFKLRNPTMFARYKELCDQGLLGIGQLWLWKGSRQWVLNFPTKRHWRQPSKIEFIEAGLRKFVLEYEHRGIREIAFPRLGCGNGGLDWDDVRPLMERYLRPLPIPVYVHDFSVQYDAPEHLKIENSNLGGAFESFLNDMRKVIEVRGGSFSTIAKKSEFSAKIDERNNLSIHTSKSVNTIFEDDLFDFWLVLQKAPVSTARMVGSANSYGNYLISILSHLPYLRVVQTSQSPNDGRIAVERVRSQGELQRVN